MELKQLKQLIIDKKDIELPLIFVDNVGLLSSQYIKAIAENTHKELIYIETLNDIPQVNNDIFGAIDNNIIYILKIDKLSENIENIKNIIIVTKNIDKNINKNIIINIPEIEDWQLLDYIKTKIKGCTENQFNFLFENLKSEPLRLDHELDKVAIFPEASRKFILQQMFDDGCFDDLTSFNIFSISNALITKNIEETSHILEKIKNIDVNAIGLTTILYNNFKNIINIQLGFNPTADSLGLSQKQFNALKYRINRYSGEKLINIFKIILNIDKKLKLGELPVEIIIDYLVLNILS